MFGNENGSLILFLILEKLKIKIKRPTTLSISNGLKALAWKGATAHTQNVVLHFAKDYQN